jgi:hypothetical protein
MHRSGRLHSDADGLSRAPTGCPKEEEEILLLNVTVVPFALDIGLALRESVVGRHLKRDERYTAHSRD